MSSGTATPPPAPPPCILIKTDMESDELSRSPCSSAHSSPPPPPLLTPVKIISVSSCGEVGSGSGGGGAGGIVFGGAGGGRGVRRGAVGRMVDCTQADDRRMIHLVRDRPLLYARSNLPVASYQAEVKKLWREVADIMGWTVADVRRKWSHIRNSYSRHLRNEIHGVRTGKGRIVSRWYLADELEFLREHMATDTRASPSMPYSLATFLKVEQEDEQATSWYSSLSTASTAAPAPAAARSEHSDTAGVSEENEYFQFFRGIYEDYRQLEGRQQRAFRRRCLVFLHELLDGGASPSPSPAVAPSPAPVDLSSDHS